jgi:tetratricopeptide (TPR) repeat protein
MALRSPRAKGEGVTMVDGTARSWSARLRRWWGGRRWTYLIRAVPALVAGLGIVTCAILVLCSSSAERDARYLEQAKAAFKACNYPRAMTCYERLVPIASGRSDVLWGLAQTAEATGDPRRAALLVSSLAPPRRRGYGPAHFLVARQLLSAPDPSREVLDAAEEHLVHALEGELEDADLAHALLGQIYLTRDRLEEAEAHLSRAAKNRPQMRLWLARVYAKKKDGDRARHEAEAVVRIFRARAQTDPSDHQARLIWADALAFLEDFQGAVTVLEERAATSDSIYRPVLARVYLAWYDSQARVPGRKPAENVALLEKGLRYDAVNKDLLNRLLGLLRQDGGAADETRRLLKNLAATGKGTAAVHFVLGSDAWNRHQLDEARLHLDLAYQMEPGLGVVGNNLAWLLTQGPSPDLPRALEIINHVLKRYPDEATFRDTRGQILVRMHRWKEALPDLEAALARLPDRPAIHGALADVYQNLGDAEIAAEHRRLSRLTPPANTP